MGGPTSFFAKRHKITKFLFVQEHFDDFSLMYDMFSFIKKYHESTKIHKTMLITCYI